LKREGRVAKISRGSRDGKEQTQERYKPRKNRGAMRVKLKRQRKSKTEGGGKNAIVPLFRGDETVWEYSASVRGKENSAKGKR